MHDDNALVRRTLRGDKRAFEMIITRYQQPLLNYLGRMTGERELALDFTQEVFLKVYASLPSFQPRYKFSTWLFKIASNFMIDHWRKKRSGPFPWTRPSTTGTRLQDPGPGRRDAGGEGL